MKVCGFKLSLELFTFFTGPTNSLVQGGQISSLRATGFLERPGILGGGVSRGGACCQIPGPTGCWVSDNCVNPCSSMMPLTPLSGLGPDPSHKEPHGPDLAQKEGGKQR